MNKLKRRKITRFCEKLGFKIKKAECSRPTYTPNFQLQVVNEAENQIIGYISYLGNFFNLNEIYPGFGDYYKELDKRYQFEQDLIRNELGSYKKLH